MLNNKVMVLEYLASFPPLQWVPVIFVEFDLRFCHAILGHFKQYKSFLTALPGRVNILAGISDKDRACSPSGAHSVPLPEFPWLFLGGWMCWVLSGRLQLCVDGWKETLLQGGNARWGRLCRLKLQQPVPSDSHVTLRHRISTSWAGSPSQWMPGE